jgi:hypothetical protein
VYRRILVPLALLLMVASALTACGGGGSDEDKIVETIETAATTADPSNCTELQTQAFNEQNNEVKGKAATKACEEHAEEGKEQAKGATVSDVSVNEDKATAKVEFEGGSLDAQTLEVALVQQDGDWKVDQVEGFAVYEGKALGAAFEKEFKENPEGVSHEQAKCIGGKIAALDKKEAEALFFGGSSEPIIELAQSCA